MRLLVLGTGRMGGSVAELAPAAGFDVVGAIGRAEGAKALTKELAKGVDVAVDFTVPSAAPALARACADVGLPLVSGTTGWDAERPSVEAYVNEKGGALLWAPNFALGVHLFAKVVAEAARRFAHQDVGFDAHLVETHHVKKLDAPSGTAKMLAKVVKDARGAEVQVTSIRTGSVPGTHEIIFDGPFEQVRLVHEARDRRLFAHGALAAARWLAGKRGIFTLDDLLGEGTR